MGFLDSLGGFLSGAAEGGQKGLGMVMDIKRQQQEERDAKMRQRYYDSQVAQGAAEGTERTRANKELERLRQQEYDLSVRQADAKTDKELEEIRHEKEILDYKKRELMNIGTINSMKGKDNDPFSNMNPQELMELSSAYQGGDPLVRAYLDSVAPDMVRQMKSNPLWNAEQSDEGVYNITPGSETPSRDAGSGGPRLSPMGRGSVNMFKGIPDLLRGGLQSLLRFGRGYSNNGGAGIPGQGGEDSTSFSYANLMEGMGGKLMPENTPPMRGGFLDNIGDGMRSSIGGLMQSQEAKDMGVGLRMLGNKIGDETTDMLGGLESRYISNPAGRDTIGSLLEDYERQRKLKWLGKNRLGQVLGAEHYYGTNSDTLK